ncbi:hypothetical protein [Amycolatopsis sp. NPDC051372]|uniref:hypothetical protein n=1 Tax=unclassified Amycolatopsis TaxID=2618356 RepID=UPI0034392135
MHVSIAYRGIATMTHLRRTPSRTGKEQEMNDSKQSAEDPTVLEQLDLNRHHV